MLREDFLKAVRTYIGKPYIFGGQSAAGYDCSGYVLYCLSQIENHLPDITANEMANVFFADCAIPKFQAQPGDLVFYGPSRTKINHVMVVLEKWSNGALVVVGARGGDSTTKTVDDARKRKAFVGVYVDYWPEEMQVVVNPFLKFKE